MRDYVALLGVRGGPAVRPGSNMPTSNLIKLGGKTILLDAGIGAIRGVVDQGVRLTDVDTILISHLHSDHFAELGPFLHTAWTTGLNHKITLYGPPGILAYWTHFQHAMSADTQLRIEDEGRSDLNNLVDVIEIDAGTIFANEALNLTAMRNNHPPLVDSFAFKFEGAGKTLVVSGDTTYMPEMVDFARNADVLVHEAMLVAGVDEIVRRNANGDERLRTHILRSHTPADQVGRLATEAAVKRLVLTHLVPDDLPGFGPDDWVNEVRKTYAGPLDIGTDGLRIDL